MEARLICSAGQSRLNTAPTVVGAVLATVGRLMGFAGLIVGGAGVASAPASSTPEVAR